ncbi:hypothetical protein SERLA73DRAFT_189687 [Serpula lacrymans var. lacrymans S7.3]|uniref:Uncharacterized protein n=1 Tax=Serpula lacrymans var. lacrymans (strain S7.3) TaxID=936435 RepID=F8QED8_SERL3|nr:hypothetical protein SERLA73DRAFT_189687 [Serpula lacrymans var. lacrymans S7.3]
MFAKLCFKVQYFETISITPMTIFPQAKIDNSQLTFVVLDNVPRSQVVVTDPEGMDLPHAFKVQSLPLDVIQLFE